MIGYASNTGTKRNLDALRAHGWRILLTQDNPTPREGLRYAVDNGAWKAFQQSKPFDEKAFWKVVEPHGAGADFVVIPDIVAGGMRSFDFSLGWLSKLPNLKLLLFPVQDKMIPDEVCEMLRREKHLGIFLGGSTDYKKTTMHYWGGVAAGLNRHFHVGRVNTVRRIRLCHEAGTDSFDGTSATMYSVNLPMLDRARRQPSLFSPLKAMV